MLKVKYGKVELMVRRATVRDDLNRQVMKAKLEEGVPDGTFGFWRTFAELVSQTVKAKGYRSIQPRWPTPTRRRSTRPTISSSIWIRS